VRVRRRDSLRTIRRSPSRGGRATPLLGVLAALLLPGCDAPPTMSRALPAPRGHAAILVVRARDCDSRLRLAEPFQRRDVRDGLPLAGVVALDTVLDRASLRAALDAYDVDAPLIAVSARDRERLRALVQDHSMSIVVYDGDREAVRVVAPPRSLTERSAFEMELVSLAARFRAR
jgi:hypothetical protein